MKLPYYRSLAGAVKANLQGGRGGACTTYFSCFDPEAMTIINLQNPRSTRDKQNRDIHFAIMFNRLFAVKVMKNEDIFTFNVKTAPDLMAAFFDGDSEKFEAIYNQYKNDPNFKKNYVSARKILLAAGQQSFDVGTLYYFLIDEANRHTPFKDPIHSSNLCVAPETKILTDKGYFKISDLTNEVVNVWNGKKFTETTVRQTSELSKLIRVVTDSGYWLDCTPQHKFYIQETYNSNKNEEIQAGDLKPGMKLIKFDLPVIEGHIQMKKPYINGFYTGDGCLTPQGQRVYLYGEKQKLAHLFVDCGKWTIQENQDRMYTHYNDLVAKFFVPDARYTVNSRLEWLAGISDSDGVIYRNEDNQQLVISSINLQFMESVALMLQTLGVMSKVRKAVDAGYRPLPANDGTGDNKDFYCQSCYRLIIPSNELQHLIKLGIVFHRLKVVDHQPQRSATKFVQILDIVDNGRYDATYCFTESERHMGMFNGILTGQCNEISEPTAPYTDMRDLYSEEDHGRGEIALCSLSALVEPNIKSDEEYASAAYYSLKMIDKCIHLSDYALPHVGVTAKRRLNAGVGLMGVATRMAKLGLKYDTSEGLAKLHQISERHAYFLIKASLQLGQELGTAPWMHKTKWPEGWLPIDTYKKAVDELVAPNYHYDWESLRQAIIASGGLRNSTLIAHMPGESSSKASGCANGIYPVRDLNMKKTDAHNAIDWCAVDDDIYGDQYQSAWEIDSVDMVKAYSVIQKFTDQSISADLYRDRTEMINITTDEIINVFKAMIKYGLKSRYYQNSLTSKQPASNDGESEHEDALQEPNAPAVCGSGGCTL
jgi:ribonucleoside-diphosphate reductase alpha chain